MDVKLNPQGYLIYATMATYLFGFIPAMLCKALQFKEHLKKMGLRAILAGTGLSLFGTLFILMVAIRHRFNYGFFPYKDLRIALLALGSLFAVFFLIGLIAIILWFLFVTSSRNQTGKLTQVLGMISRMFLIASVILVWVTYIYRWIHVKHLPMQNLFEVFLTLGVLIVPLSVFCKRYFRIDALASDLLLGFVILFPAGFFFHSEPQKLPPALQCWLFAPHVAVYMLSYVFMAKAAVQAVFQLWTKDLALNGFHYEQATYNLIRLGFPLLTLGLILGSWWGKLSWGDWWGWDPKELWSLASWLVYVFYFHWRYMQGRKYPSINSILAIFGLTVIIITLLWVNLSKLFAGLHTYAA